MGDLDFYISEFRRLYESRPSLCVLQLTDKKSYVFEILGQNQREDKDRYVCRYLLIQFKYLPQV